MSAPLTLLRAALTSPLKRPPYATARLPGTSLSRGPVAIDAAGLRSYAQVCGFGHTDPLPPTYPHVLGFPLAMRLMAARSFPFPVLGLVHTRIELAQRAPFRAADRPEISVRAEGPEPHAKGTQFDLVTTAALDGEEVWHSRSTYLCRHRTDAESTGDGGSGGNSGSGESDRRNESGSPLHDRDTWELPAHLGRRYGAASGDRNPIHLHPLTARLFGFPRAIAHGMWTFARCLAESATGEEGDGPFTAEARFRAPVLLPSTVTYAARDGRFEIRSGVAGNRVHLSGRASSGPPSSGSPAPPSRSS